MMWTFKINFKNHLKLINANYLSITNLCFKKLINNKLSLKAKGEPY